MQTTGMSPFELPRVPPLQHPWCDSSASPLFAITWPPRSDAIAVQEYIDALAKWIPQVRSPWVAMVDSTHFQTETSTALVRQVFATGIKNLAPLMGQQCVGLSAVTPSPLARGVVTAVLWATTLPCPLKMHATTHEARAWLSEQLAQASRSGRMR